MSELVPPKTDERIAVAIDCSGSTGGNKRYWEIVMSVIRKYGDTATYYLWDTTCSIVSRIEAEKRADSKKGGGGTDPSCFINYIIKGEYKTLYLVTDGEIPQSELQKSDEMLVSHDFKNVIAHIINSNPNLSVIAPFTRNTDHFIIIVNGEQLSFGSTKDEIKWGEYENNVEKFFADYENIYKQVAIKSLGVDINGSNSAAVRIRTLRIAILELQKKLINCISRSNASSDTVKIDNIRNSSNDCILLKLKEMITIDGCNVGKKVTDCINNLLHACNNKDSKIDILSPSRLLRASTVTTDPNATLDEPTIPTTYICPITYEYTGAVLKICCGEPILSGLPKEYMDILITNPLKLLNDKNLVNKIEKRLDFPEGMDASNNLIGKPSCFTRKNLIPHGFACGMEQSHIDATDYALSNLFFGDKLVGNRELWLAVVYFVILKIPYLSENVEFMTEYTNMMLNRMKKMSTNITLSGLPIEPLMKCPVDIAILYCVLSWLLGISDRLRAMSGTEQYLIAILDLFKYPYDKEATLRRIDLCTAFATMMTREKKNEPWRDELRMQYQNYIILTNDKIVFLDGPPRLDTPAHNYSPNLSVADLCELAELVDSNKTVNNVDIPKDFTSGAEPQYVTNYGYPVTTKTPNKTRICPETLRPYLICPRRKISWEDCANETCPLNKQVSVYNYFLRYIAEYKKYPTKFELIEYMAIRQLSRIENRMDTLPLNIITFVDYLFTNYKKVLGEEFEEITPTIFNEIVNKSRDKKKRAVMEESDKLILSAKI